jgi:hypothetical protein
MEGVEVTVTPTDLVENCPADGWELALAAPGVDGEVTADEPLTLADSQAVLFRRAD